MIRPNVTAVQAIVALSIALASNASAQAGHKVPRQSAGSDDLSQLRQFSRSVEALVTRVSPSVVQIIATGYGTHERSPSTADLVLGRRRSLGSGVIVDSEGYIVTNAHVVSGARRIQVLITGARSDASPIETLLNSTGGMADARIVGLDRELDLALLKVEMAGLRAIRLADYDKLQQGEIVFAFGSPEGLRDSVTMGVVSAVARQPDPDDPRVFIQTDAPINPGNSGGPLVNADGELVGINTFIVSVSGGSQGLGFAIPSALVAVAYPKLKKHGQLRRGAIGVDLQAITPELAEGLKLSRQWGLVVSDVVPGGPAAAVGIEIGDVMLSINGRSIDSLPSLLFELYTHGSGERMKLRVLRGSDALSFDVSVIEATHNMDRLSDLVNPDTDMIQELGVVGLQIDDRISSLLPDLRIASGVIVVAHAEGWRGEDAGLSAGDVIHAVNNIPVRSLADLRTTLNSVPGKRSVALQIEHSGKLMFIAFDLGSP
jgi:serine protease Do